MIRPILDLLSQHISAHHLFRYTSGIWQTDRWFTSDKFRQTHEWAVEQMLRDGADEAEVVEIPADGKTRYENWIMPMAFDCRGARLEVVEPSYQLLADWTQTPQCVVQWCGPTGQGSPAEPVVAPLVLADSLDPNEAGAARGRIVLTARSGRELRVQADKWQAAAVVSYFLPDYIPDRERVTCWTNAWSTSPGGWAVAAGETSMPGFNLPPARGQQLADRLKAGEKIILRAWADTSVQEGILTVSTGVIRGSDPATGEVLLLGHAAEVGANDNASGCAVMLETIRVLGGLIRSGQLPRPRRTIRVLLTSEIYGMIGYSGNRDSLSRTVAALHFDLVGDGPSPTRPICLYEQGPTNPSYVNELVCMINEAMPDSLGGPNLPFNRVRYTGVADDMIGDPAFGVPCAWIGRPTKNNPFYHSSGDTLDTLSPTAMLHSAGTAAAFSLFVASAGDEQAGWLAERLIDRARPRRVESPADDGSHLLNYQLKAEATRCAELAAGPAAKAIRERVNQSLPGFEQPLADLAATPAEVPERRIVRRKTRGVLSFQGRDPELLAKFPYINWDGKSTSALYWADGRRNIAQLRRLAQAEWNVQIKTDLVALFEAAAKCGMIALGSPNCD